MADLELALMKMLMAGPWQRAPKGPKLGLDKLSEALGKLGTPCGPAEIVEPLQNAKGRGYMNTEPKIILKEEWPTAEFQLWLTPLGKNELQKRLSGDAAGQAKTASGDAAVGGDPAGQGKSASGDAAQG